MYLTFFGLTEKPFAITPDPRYLYLSERHAEALAHLMYGIREAGGFVQLTGEVGTGKTTIVRSLLAQAPRDAEIALILNPRMTALEFLTTICEELRIEVPEAATGSGKHLVDQLNRHLLRAHGEGRRTVLVVDEAQNLATDVLEQVRLLTNLETNTQKLLQIILIGQPELREVLARSELRQLAQRITGRYHLDPLSRAETEAYVRHRLRVAGATADIFTGRALAEVYRLSAGVPRVINVICDRALLGAYTQDRHRVTAALVRRAAGEVFGRRFAPRWLPWLAASGAAVALGAIAVLAWRYGMPVSITSSVAAPAPVAVVAGVPADTAPARAPPLPEPAPVSLDGLLAKHAGGTDTDDAFQSLFALWKARYVPGAVDPCTQAAEQGLECLVQRGSFGQLRLYNRPAILLLGDDSGRSHQVVLSGLDDAHGRVELGGKSHEIGIAELSRQWLGDFVLLWRPVTPTVKNLSLGMQGDEVRWLRESLHRLAGSPRAEVTSDVYDVELGRLVMDFQRRNRLSVDGIAGVQTQLVLASAVADPDSPLLLLAQSTSGS
jgi:general secretion pathway protein A